MVEQYLTMKSFIECIKLFVINFPNSVPPHKSSISRVVSKFHSTGSVGNQPKVHTRTVLMTDKLAEIKDLFETEPRTSLRKVSLWVHTPFKTVHRAMRPLKLYLYQINMLQELKPANCPKCVASCEWLLNMSRNNVFFFDDFVFSDEAWF